MKNKLEMKKGKRKGNHQPTDWEFLDFIVDGQSMRNLLKTENITGIGWGSKEEQKKYIGQLQKPENSDLPSKRVPLYICSECGDIGCGAITIEISQEPGKVIWSRFGYENNYEDDIKCLDIYSEIGPFEFDENDYNRLLESAFGPSIQKQPDSPR
jgi:hypothetical protein